LYERESFSTFIKIDKKVTPLGVKINGITDDMLRDAPTFDSVCDRIYGVLDGRKWAGYNILNFDIGILNRAFEKYGRTPPKPYAPLPSVTTTR
jgi:DNA polymerase III epsilon subunit-like protein